MRKSINVIGIIKSKSEPKTVNRKNGIASEVCDAIIYDETGEMPITLWDDAVEKYNDGDKISITNGYTNEFRGVFSLNSGKFGIIQLIQD